MASKPKFIEVEDPYEVDEGFVEGVMDLPTRLRVRVLSQIKDSLWMLEYNDDETLEAGGRIGSELYYKIEYYNMEGWIPVLLEFDVIDCDEYLDLMVDNKLILK